MTPATVMVPVGRARWDGRVAKPDGRGGRKPVPSFRPVHGSGWFTIRRTAGPDGVELVACIPGYLAEQVTGHADQAAAEAAADEIYAGYCAAVAALAGGTGDSSD